MFYKQVIIHNGRPFEGKLPNRIPDTSRMIEVQLDAELKKGYTDLQSQRTRPAAYVFSDIRKEYGV